ncbi:hypothetical protein [Niveibacterium sp. SC-1]|uniref:hypothetical protein n=1 Tax=Niveibacterium sp. SC-1 TaxID=3135646 RepID=UPI00312037DF
MACDNPALQEREKPAFDSPFEWICGEDEVKAQVGYFYEAIRRGSFKNFKELMQKIDAFASQCDANCKPFTWTATADSIPENPAPLCGQIAVIRPGVSRRLRLWSPTGRRPSAFRNQAHGDTTFERPQKGVHCAECRSLWIDSKVEAH